ncbi:MAG: rubredoxin [Flavobacteriales bacterium]|nr:rubredoxin [Flavobacteriales bacterium]
MELTRLIVKGGVISPGELRDIVNMGLEQGLKDFSFGSRQDIIFPEVVSPELLKSFKDFEVVSPEDSKKQNIISSYVSSNIMPSTSWLTGDKYLYVLEQFRETPILKVNITDPKQHLVPVFTGNLNFIASEHEDYWYLYVRLPEWNQTLAYPVLIYSWDMARVTSAIEKLLVEEPETIETIFELVNDAEETNNITIDNPLEIPFQPFPYYEGMHRTGNDKYWLGLYWRNNLYSLDFLKAMCDLCLTCEIGKISITPWKSFIVKDIPKNSKLQWEKLLGKFGINVRHSMLELNWHLPVADEEALKLKKYLVTNFDQNDISTYGLTFGITNYIKTTNYFTSIVVEKNPRPSELSEYKIRDTYNLLYAKNFDTNEQEYIVHVQDVDMVELPGLLMELSRMYFDQLGNEKEETVLPESKPEIEEYDVYQCSECFTIYDPEYGDPNQEIEAKTPFENLENDFVCSLCEAPKSAFQKKVFTRV